MTDPISRTAYGDAPLSAARKSNPEALRGEGVKAHEGEELVGRTVSINRPRKELYAFWRDFSNLPQFMENVVSIAAVDARRSHWKVLAPAGRSVEWDAIVTEEEPGALIAWTSAEGASVSHSGRIEFRDSTSGRGTVVTATIVYDPPGGSVGKAIAKLFAREPNVQARRDLRRFKQLMETGEVSTTEPQAAAPRA